MGVYRHAWRGHLPPSESGRSSCIRAPRSASFRRNNAGSGARRYPPKEMLASLPSHAISPAMATHSDRMTSPELRSRHWPVVRAIAACSLLLGAAASQAAEQARPDPLPTEVVRADFDPEYSQGILRRFGSEPLWPADALSGYSERYRFTYSGILIYQIQVRIDRRQNGVTVLRATVRKSGKTIERKERKVSDRDFTEFRILANGSGLWSSYPEFWGAPDDDCLDGMEAIVERRTREGYRFSRANTSCNSPTGMNLLIEKMVALADLDSDVRWFPWNPRER